MLPENDKRKRKKSRLNQNIEEFHSDGEGYVACGFYIELARIWRAGWPVGLQFIKQP